MSDLKPLVSHIIWHKYPEEKPNLYEQVIISGYEEWRDEKGALPFVDVALYDPNSDWGAYDIDGFSTFNDWNEGQKLWVTAWASMPEPPKEDEEDV